MLQNIKENLDALKLQLSPGDTSAVRKLAEAADEAITGSRYPESMMSAPDRARVAFGKPEVLDLPRPVPQCQYAVLHTYNRTYFTCSAMAPTVSSMGTVGSALRVPRQVRR